MKELKAIQTDTYVQPDTVNDKHMKTGARTSCCRSKRSKNKVNIELAALLTKLMLFVNYRMKLIEQAGGEDDTKKYIIITWPQENARTWTHTINRPLNFQSVLSSCPSSRRRQLILVSHDTIIHKDYWESWGAVAEAWLRLTSKHFKPVGM